MSFISVSDSLCSAMQPIQPNSISYPIQRKPLKRKRQHHYWDDPPRKNPHKKLKYPSPADPDYVWVSGEIDQYKSRCTNMYLREASKKYHICPCEVFSFIGLSGAKHFERVYMSPALDGDDYTFFYEYMVTQFSIQFPLSTFECEVLTEMQTTPSQLAPNTWGFLQAFQIVYKYFNIEPTKNKFMFFYQMKYGESIGWISLSPASSRLKLFPCTKILLIHSRMLSLK